MDAALQQIGQASDTQDLSGGSATRAGHPRVDTGSAPVANGPKEN